MDDRLASGQDVSRGSYYEMWRAAQPRLDRVNPTRLIYGSEGEYVPGFDPFHYWTTQENLPARVVHREEMTQEEVIARYEGLIDRDSVSRLVDREGAPIMIDTSQIPQGDIDSWLRIYNATGVAMSMGPMDSDTTTAFVYSQLQSRVDKLINEENDKFKSTQLFPELSHL